MRPLPSDRRAARMLLDVLESFRAVIASSVQSGAPLSWATSARCLALHEDLLWGPNNAPDGFIFLLDLPERTQFAVEELVCALVESGLGLEELAQRDQRAFVSRAKEMLGLIAALAATAAVELKWLGPTLENEFVAVYDFYASTAARLESPQQES